MANPERGEVDLVTPTKTYTLFLSINALCDMEKRMGKSYGQILQAIMALDMSSLRAMTHAVLQKHHKSEFQTEEKVGLLIDGRMTIVKDAMVALFTLNHPPEEKKGESGNANPLQSGEDEDGTGANSTLTAVA